MRSHAVLSWVATGLAIVSAVAAAVAAWSGFVLADDYLPHVPGAERFDMSGAARSSDVWSDRQLEALVVALVAAVVVLVVVAWLAHGPGHGAAGSVRASTVYVCAVAAVAATVATLLTRDQVQWSQLHLHSVTAGADPRGYWFAAFDDGVRSAVVGDDEVSPGRYAAVMFVHLAGPLVGTVAMAVAGAALLRPRRAAAPAEA